MCFMPHECKRKKDRTVKLIIMSSKADIISLPVGHNDMGIRGRIYFFWLCIIIFNVFFQMPTVYLLKAQIILCFVFQYFFVVVPCNNKLSPITSHYEYCFILYKFITVYVHVV
jgi:hypothetical protein